MDVTNVSSADGGESDRSVQVGSPLVSESVESGFDGTTATAAEVTVRPGRTTFHAHAGVQVLYVTDGVGMIGHREERRDVSAGDLVAFDPGEEHWHGTAEDADTEFSLGYFLAESGDGELTIQEAP